MDRLALARFSRHWLAILDTSPCSPIIRNPCAVPGPRMEEDLTALRLRPHPIKSQIRRTRNGASFVGFHVVGGRIRLRHHSPRRGRRRLRVLRTGGGQRPDPAGATRPSQGQHQAEVRIVAGQCQAVSALRAETGWGMGARRVPDQNPFLTMGLEVRLCNWERSWQRC